MKKKRISIQSAKQKGRLLQQYVRDKILTLCPTLTPDDVRSTGMGQSGHDIMLSNAGKKRFPVAVECKSLARHAIYKAYKQAVANSKKDTWDGYLEPLVIIKVNKEQPLAVIDAEFMLCLLANLWSENEDLCNSGHTNQTRNQNGLPDLDRKVSSSKAT